ncbi:MAG: YncE family protein, partial [Steroidobacteraceae bacterium]
LLLALALASPAGAATLLVLNKDDATLSFIDPATRSSTATVTTGAGPHEVEVTADGRTAVVSNYGGQTAGDSLTVVDLDTRKERARVNLGDLHRPHGLATSGRFAYFTAEDARHIGRLDTATGQVDWRFPTNQQRTHMVVASRDGRTLFTSNMGSSNISIIERSADGAARQTLVNVGKTPEGLDLTPDGRQLWTSNAEGGSVSIVDVATRKLVKTFDVGTRRSNRIKFTPDGTLALVSDIDAGELVVIDVKSQAVKLRLPIGRSASGILVVPDGSHAYVAATGERKVVLVDLQSLTVSGQVATGGGPDGMAWVR